MRPYHFRARCFLKYDAAIFQATRSELSCRRWNGRNGNDKTKLEEDICIHIFTVSAAMVGVCLTVIGLIRVVITLGKADTLADDLLACDALLFLTSCLLSYGALRARSFCRMHRIERAADVVFITAMVVMTLICRFITYAMSISPSTVHW
jgi:branched-subunit amino acid permease